MQVDRFVIQGELARGGLGVVYRAHDTALGGAVALKVLQDGALTSDIARARFHREAQALGRLRHPNVVPFRGAGEVRGCPYLAMDLIEGETLHARIRRQGTLQPREAARLIHDLALGLEHAHQAGVIHRDVKPSNVLIDGNDRPLLTDFGLAGDLTPGSGSKLTRSGMYLGTPGYWAPEQARGRLDQVGPTTDVYALGATLYACLTGVPPVRESSDLGALLEATIKTPPTPPRELSPDVDPALQAICLKALAKAPGDRYPSCEAFGWELAAYLAEEHRAAPARARLGLAIGALLVAAVGIAGAVALAPVDPAPVASASPTAPRVSPPDPYAQPAPAEGATESVPAASKPTPSPTTPATAAPSPTTTRAPAPATGTPTLRSTPVPPPPQAPRNRAAQEAYRQALRHAERGELEAAAQAFKRALRHDPKFLDAYLGRGRIRRRQKRWSLAHANFGSAMQAHPQSALPHLERANTFLLQAGKTANAIRAYDAAIRLQPGLVSAYLNRGAAKNRIGDTAGAMADWTKAIELQPTYHLAYINRGRAHRVGGRLTRALRDFDAAVEHAPREPPTDLANAYQNRGRVLIELKRPVDALRDLDALVKLRPDNAAYTLRGAALANAGRTQEAIQDYTKALAIDPKNAVARRNRGSCWFRLKQWKRAVVDLSAGLASKPKARDAWVKLVRGLTILKLHPQVVQASTMALRHYPRAPELFLYRGTAHEKLGKPAESLRDLQAGLKILPPGDERVARVRNEIARLTRKLSSPIAPPR